MTDTKPSIPDLAAQLRAGLNGDPDQRAATELLITAASGVWLLKLSGWPEYLRPTQDTRRGEALWIDWQTLTEDLVADDHAWAVFTTWADSLEGRRASEQDYDQRRDELVPRRPWHGASSSELVVLRIAVELAPGGLLGDGIARLDEHNRAAVATAIDTLITGQYLQPAWAQQ
jgi:hypothetical protein